MLKQNTFFLSILILFSVFNIDQGFSQNANIRGFIYLKENAEPVIFTNVYLQGTSYGASSDVNGYYSITKVPPGTYTLLVTYLGYDTLKETITVKAGDILTRKLYVSKSSIQLGAVEISAEKQAKETEVGVSVTKITLKEIKQIPTVGGDPDLAQYLQVLPGVVSTGDQGGQLYIRGGSPIQNKVLLDGMIIYNPFHSIGLFSVFDADIIRNADVYAGGFGAQYGGRISSIMDITTRDGNKKNVAGKVSVSPFGAKTLIEGPIKKYTDADKSNSSFVISAKTSYLEQSSKVLYPYVNNGTGLPYNFADYYGKISFNGTNGSKLNIFGFNFNDQVSFPQVTMGWTSSGVGSNFIVIPSSSPILIDGHFAYSNYSIGMKQESAQPDSSRISGFNMGLNFTYFIGKSELTYGIEAIGYSTNFSFYNTVNRQISQEATSTELAGFIKYKYISPNKKLVIEPSFRLQYYASLDEFSPEPRLGIKYNATHKLRFKFAGGLYSQNLMSAASDRDVVNLFYGFLTGPDNLQQNFTKQNGDVVPITSRLQKAAHLIIGTEYDLGKHIEINLEAYQKYFTQLTNLNDNKLYDDNADNASKPDAQKKDFIIETGLAEGIDLTIKYDYKHLTLWAVYSFGYNTRWDGVEEYFPQFDRRHNVNLVSSYVFGKNLNWEVDARWNLGSGFPFTQTQGYYPNQTFANGVNTNYTNQNESLGIAYAGLDQGRLPYYHRLDLSVKRKFVLTENSTLEANAGVTNAYNRDNIFYYDRVLNERVNQLPILPSVSVSWVF